MAGFFDDTEETTSPVVKSFFDDTEEINTPVPTDSDFIPGVKRGLQNLQASAYGATALAGSGLKKFGMESTGQNLQDFGMEGYNRNIEEAKQYPKKNSFKDIYIGEAGVGGAVDWAQGTLGELVPSMAEAAVGAIAGSAIAPGAGTVAGGLAGRTILKKGIDEAVKQSVKRGIGDLTETQVRKQLTGQALKKFGGKVGIAGSVMPLESGGMYAELLQEKGIDAPETALLFGALATSLEFAGGNSKLVDTFVDALSKGSTGTIKKSAKELLTNIPQEALQEGGQELLSVLNTVANTDEKLLTADNVERIIESMAAGAIGGGAGAAVNAGFSAQAKDPGPGKTDAEVELDRRAANILNLKEDELGKSIQTLNETLKLNKEILDDPYKLDQKARELNVDQAELIRKTVEDNKNNQSLLDRINSGIQKKEELAKKEYEALSPEEKEAKEIENKLSEKRITDAQKINDDLDTINKREEIALKQYKDETDPTKKASIADRIFNLKKEKNTLLDRQLQQKTNQVSDFEGPKKADEIRQEKENFYNQLWLGGVNKDANESAQVFGEKSTEQQDILDRLSTQIANTQSQQKKQELQKVYDGLFQTFERDAQESAETIANADLSQFDQLVKAKDQERLNKVLESIVVEPDPQARQTLYEKMFMQPGVKDAADSAEVFATQGEDADTQFRKQELQKVMSSITQESDPAIRQKLYNQMFEQPGVKNAQESAEVFLTQKFTEREKAVIEDYWQGVKKELNLIHEEMTPGTEAFMRKKFFETQLANIEGNVKSDTTAQSEAKQNVVSSLAEQNKRQEWFQQIAKDLGDVPTPNSQAVETEIPRNLPGGLQSWFTNERQVGSAPQFQVGETDSKKIIKEAGGRVILDNPGGSWLEEQRKKAKAKDERTGFRHGSVTAKINRIELPIDSVVFLRGMEGEDVRLDHLQDFQDTRTIMKIRRSISENGYLPDKAIFINVGYDGTALINEGNHRVRAAKLAGLKTIPVEIAYFAGGESVNGPLSLDSIARMVTKNEEAFEVRENQETLGKVNLDDIKGAFPGQEINQSPDGTISVKFKNGQGLTINSIQNAGQGFVKLAIETGQMSKNGKILGITIGNEILLDENFADNKTLWHENKHVLDNLGLITEADDSALNKEFNKLRKAGKLDFALSTYNDPKKSENENKKQRMVENRANMFAQIMVNRAEYRNTAFGKVIQRVMDFFQQLLSFGKQTVSGLAREVESGKLYERQVNGQTVQVTVPQAEEVASKWYSALENAVAGFNQKQATPDQWKGMIKNFPGLKQDELDWVGVNDWLDKQEGKVTQADLLKFVQENNVSLEEVVKEELKLSSEIQKMFSAEGISAEYDPQTNRHYFTNSLGNDIEFNELSEDLQEAIYNNFPDSSNTKHSHYQLPDGKNYKELILTLPSEQDKKTYTHEVHWPGVVNPLVHIRFNERTDADGNKVLFLEEIQSDWHQEGKKKGYENPNIITREMEIKRIEDKYPNINFYSGPSGLTPGWSLKEQGISDEDFEVFKDIMLGFSELPREADLVDSVPNAPFKNSTQWSLLVMKRMVRYAAENGFDKIAWTTGQQQFDRYAQGTEEEKAKRLHGMQEFYDKILPNTFNAEFNKNKWGNAKVEVTNIPQGEYNPLTKKFYKDGYEAEARQQLSLPITNRMKSKALREGMPMFEVRETPAQKISDDVYHQMFTERNSLVRTIGQTLRMRGHEIKQLIDKGLGSISTRLKNVDPMLRAEIRNLDFRTAQKIVTALRIAHPLLEKTKQMSPQDKFVWDAARRNSDEGKIKEIAAKYNMTADQEKLRTVLDQIRQDAIDVGYDVGFIEEYWPRIIKDQEGFLQATKGISQRPVITDAIKVYADKLGMTVEKFEIEYPEQAADIASNTILGRNLGIGGPGNIQARQYETVPPELNKFYMDSDAALMQYIYSMTKKIEARRFFGKVPERIATLKTEKKRKQVMLTEYEKSNNTARIEDVSGDLLRIEQELDKYKLQRDYTENIGTYINDLRMSGRIQADDEKVVRDILDARFHEHGATGIVNAYKNMSYIDVMGSPISALTQIGDLAWAMYVGKVWTPRGLADTVKNVGKAITKKSEITKEDLGIERIAQEFADGTTLGNAVSWVFKKVGLERIDSIGKETLINNAFSNYKVMASTEAGRTELLKQIKPIFGTQSESVINDLLAGNPTDNVKMLLYHRLLDFQPVALSEMSEQYLKSGNGRVFYMLKTYTLKQFDVFRNEAWHKIKTGERDQVIEGIGNMIKLVSLLTLANAGADELKDWMLGKETKFEDNVIENFLTMGGASKFVRMQTAREGLGSGLIGQILPPFRFVNSISKDLNQLYGSYITGDTIDFDHARIVESIPIGGKIYYWHYGRGEDYKKSSNEQEFSKVSKEVDIFKKQLENSEDKRTFLNSNLDGFKQMKLHENFQSALNRNQAVINKLKKIEQTTNVRERLGQLQHQREVILKRYFEVVDTMQ